MPITLDSLVVQSPLCLSAAMAEEVVLMTVEGGVYFGLDPVGGDIWHRIAAPCLVRDLCTALCADYDGPAAIIEADVLALLTTLTESGVVEVQA